VIPNRVDPDFPPSSSAFAEDDGVVDAGVKPGHDEFNNRAWLDVIAGSSRRPGSTSAGGTAKLVGL
jgi:hypothetical protein